MPEDLNGQVAVVTGAGRGFGRAIAVGLAAAGAAVTVTARTESELQETVEAITSAGGRAIAVPGDVTSRDDVQRVKQATDVQFGPATLVVHNAGVPWPFGPVWHVDPDEWWSAQAVHVRGAMLYLNTFVPAMIERGGGRAIVITSTASLAARPNLSGYAVAKNAQNRLVEHLALEGREHNVHAFAVHPGSVFTGISVETISDPDAQKYLPGFVERLHNQRANDDPSIGLKACGDFCVAIAAGRWDAYSGHYLDPAWKLEEMPERLKASGL
jgi:NAD(P)-dependent dehydrogenase (short-subunit alcohol dehydrogenase family)